MPYRNNLALKIWMSSRIELVEFELVKYELVEFEIVVFELVEFELGK